MKSITACFIVLLLVTSSSVVAMAATPSTSKVMRLHQSSVAASLTAVQDSVDAGHAATEAYWEAIQLPANVKTATIHSLAVDPTDANTAFLATTYGLYRTTDAGDTWARVNQTTFEDVAEVLIATDNPQRIYVRAWDFYRSDDGGISWHPTPSAGAPIASSLQRFHVPHGVALMPSTVSNVVPPVSDRVVTVTS